MIAQEGPMLTWEEVLTQPLTVPIRHGIPRFVPDEGYTSTFGLQWQTFARTQLDSVTGVPLSATRLWEGTGWRPAELKGALVLEVGSGAGRFTEVLLGAGARVVTCDYSSRAIEANWASNAGNGDVLFMQADLHDLPVKDALFDYVLCYGVLQHCPAPEAAYQALWRKVKPGGRIAVDIYRRTWRPHPWTWPKYLWRPLTRRMRPETLLRLVRWYVPKYLPMDTALKSLPRGGGFVAGLLPVPCYNYKDMGLPPAQQVEAAVLDTFDALSAAHDHPRTWAQVVRMVRRPDAEAVDVRDGGNGVVANARKRG